MGALVRYHAQGGYANVRSHQQTINHAELAALPSPFAKVQGCPGPALGPLHPGRRPGPQHRCETVFRPSQPYAGPVRYLAELWKQTIESSGRHQTVLGLIGAAILALAGQVVSGLKAVHLVSNAFGATDLVSQAGIFIALEIVVTFVLYVLVVSPIRMWYRSESRAVAITAQADALTVERDSLANDVAAVTSERDQLRAANQRPLVVVNNYYGTTTAAPTAPSKIEDPTIQPPPQALPAPDADVPPLPGPEH
jgi:hypothetical protein